MSSQKPPLKPLAASHKSSLPRLLLLFCCLAGGAIALVYLVQSMREFYRPGARYSEEGVEAVARKNPMEAEKKWLEGVAKDPEYSANLEQLGDLYAGEKRNSEAIAFYGRALKLTPNEGSLLLRIAQIEHRIDRDDLAYPHSKRAAELLADDANAQALYGLLEDKQGHYSAAIPPLQKALALHPEMSDALGALVNSQFAANDLVGAERTDEDWLARHPQDPFAMLWKAKIAAQKPAAPDSLKTAIEAALSAYKAMPDNLEAHRVLGQVYLNLNRPADAKLIFQDGLTIFPFAVAMLQGMVSCYARLGDAPHLETASSRLRDLNTKLDRLDHVREIVILHKGKDLKSNFELAQLESDVGHFQEAQDYFNQLEKDAPNDPQIQAAVAAFRERAKQYLQGRVRVLP